MTASTSLSGHPFLAAETPRPPGALKAFLNWWGGELHSLFGSLTGSRLKEIHWTGEGFGDAAGNPLRRPPAQALLVWPAGRVLRRTLSLPLAAEHKLSPAIRFELGRHLPFAAEQAVYRCKLKARDVVKGQLTLEATIIRRDEVQNALNHAQDLGVRLVGLIADGQLVKGRARRPWSGLEKLLGLALAAALAAAIGVPSTIYSQRLDALESAGLDISRRMDTARAVAIGRQAPALILTGLAAERRARPSPLMLLEDLTRRLPDEVWVRFLSLDGKTLKLEGSSASAAELVGLLEASDWVSGVRFLSPTVIDPITGLERFRLTAEIKPVWPDVPGEKR